MHSHEIWSSNCVSNGASKTQQANGKRNRMKDILEKRNASWNWSKCTLIECKWPEFLFCVRIYSTSAVSGSSVRSFCLRDGCLRRDTLGLAFSVVVVGGFSRSSNCLSVRMSLYQSALDKESGANKNVNHFEKFIRRCMARVASGHSLAFHLTIREFYEPNRIVSWRR